MISEEKKHSSKFGFRIQVGILSVLFLFVFANYDIVKHLDIADDMHSESFFSAPFVLDFVHPVVYIKKVSQNNQEIIAEIVVNDCWFSHVMFNIAFYLSPNLYSNISFEQLASQFNLSHGKELLFLVYEFREPFDCKTITLQKKKKSNTITVGESGKTLHTYKIQAGKAKPQKPIKKRGVSNE